MHGDDLSPGKSGSGNLTFVIDLGNVSNNDSNLDLSSECSVSIGELYLLIIIAIESFFLAVSIGISIYMFLGKRRLRGEGIINQTFEGFEGEEGDYIHPAEPQLRLYETILHLSPSRRSSRGTENPYEMLHVNNHNNNNSNNNNNNNSTDQTAVLVVHSREHSYDIVESKENGTVATVS